MLFVHKIVLVFLYLLLLNKHPPPFVVQMRVEREGRLDNLIQIVTTISRKVLTSEEK